MNVLDYIIVGLLIWGFISGFRRGLVMELALLLGFFLGVFLALRGSGALTEYLQNEQHMQGRWIPHLSFVLIFVGVYVLAWFAGKAISMGLNLVMLGIFNKLAGGVFGLLKMLMLCSVVLSLVKGWGWHMGSEETEQQARMYEHVQGVVPSIFPGMQTLIEPNDPISVIKDAVLGDS